VHTSNENSAYKEEVYKTLTNTPGSKLPTPINAFHEVMHFEETTAKKRSLSRERPALWVPKELSEKVVE
jgi:hypothetical protein